VVENVISRRNLDDFLSEFQENIPQNEDSLTF